MIGAKNISSAQPLVFLIEKLTQDTIETIYKQKQIIKKNEVILS